MTVFPEGLIHYQQNLGCGKVQFISGLNSEDPGVVTVTQRLFDLPLQAVSSSLNLVESDIFSIKTGLPLNPAQGRKE